MPIRREGRVRTSREYIIALEPVLDDEIQDHFQGGNPDEKNSYPGFCRSFGLDVTGRLQLCGARGQGFRHYLHQHRARPLLFLRPVRRSDPADP